MYICATAVVAAQVNGDQQTEKRYRQFDVIYFQYKLLFYCFVVIAYHGAALVYQLAKVV